MCCLADVSLRLPVTADLFIESISPRPSGLRLRESWWTYGLRGQRARGTAADWSADPRLIPRMSPHTASVQAREQNGHVEGWRPGRYYAGMSSRLRYVTESHPQPGGRTVKIGREAKARMSLWRIRIAMSDDWRSQELLTEALAGQRVCSRLMSPHETEMSVDVIIELTDVDGLGTLLGELHMISPQVFVSSADQPSPLPA